MGDSWRFDPYKDYTNDDSEENNFHRFKKSKHKQRQNEGDFDKSYGKKSHNKKQKFQSNRNWR